MMSDAFSDKQQIREICAANHFLSKISESEIYAKPALIRSGGVP
jgi:hypothetical protein